MNSQPASATHSVFDRPLWQTLGIVFFLALLFQLLAMDRTIGIYDEALDLYGADMVAHGGVPYRDFFTLYAPAQFYVIAGLFKLFGTTALIARIYDLFVRTGICLLSAMLVARLASRRAALFAGAAVLLWLAGPYIASYDFPVFPALLLALLACTAANVYLSDPTRKRFLFLGGFCAGLAANFRHDTGFYAWLAQAVVIAWACLAQRGIGLPTRLRTSIIDLSLLSTAAVLPLLLFFLPVALAAGLQNTYINLFYVPAVIYPKVRALPYPTLHLIFENFLHRPFSEMDNIVYFPCTVWLASALALLDLRSTPSQSDQPWKRRGLALLLLLDLFFFITGNGRVGFIQMMSAILTGIVVISIVASYHRQLRVASKAAVVFSLVWLLLCSLPLVIELRWHAGANLRALLQPSRSDSLRSTCVSRPGLNRARCLIVDPAEIATIQDIEQHTVAGDRIYVGVTKHDSLVLNNLRLYFLAARPSATRWHMLHPGIQTTYKVQSEMVRSLEDLKPKVIVESAFPPKPEPNDSRLSSGVTLLDDYIAAYYTPEKTFPVPEGPETVLLRNSGPSQSTNPTGRFQSPLPLGR